MRVWQGFAAGLAAWLTVSAASSQPVAMIEHAYQAQVTARLKAPLAKSGLFDDKALRVVLCGTSSPIPDPTRARSCTAVIVGGKAWIIDSGPGSVSELMLMGFPLDRVAGVLLTHYHSDHIGDLGELRMQSWAAGRSAPLPVYGPQGVETVVRGVNLTLSLDDSYRTLHHGEAVMPSSAPNLVANTFAPGVDGSVVVLKTSALTITAFWVKHDPIKPAVAYRIDAGGRSVVVTGDTAADASVVRAARGADVLVSEAMSLKMVKAMQQAATDAGNARQAKLFGDIQNYHTPTLDAAREANEAGVKLLVLSHLTPGVPQPVLEKLFTDGMSAVRDPKLWVLGFDGMRIDLPYAGGEPVVGKLAMLGRN